MVKPCVLDALTGSSLSTAVGKNSRDGSEDMMNEEALNILEHMFWMDAVKGEATKDIYLLLNER